MKIRFFLRIILIVMGLTSPSIADSKLQAVVGKEYITSKDIDNRYALLAKTNPNIQNNESTREHILNLLIDESVQMQEAAHFAIISSEKDIKERMDDIAKNNPNISAQDPEFKKHITAVITWINFVNAKFHNGIHISEKELNDAIKLQTKSEQVELMQIMIPAELFDREPAKIESMASSINSCKEAELFTEKLQIEKPLFIKDDERNLSEIIQQIVNNLKTNQISNLINDSNNNKHLFIICAKHKIHYTENEKPEVKAMLIEKKISLAAKNLLSDLKKKYFIEIKK